ncbi:AMP_1a_G0000060.mRNA.1.CDS.1 [Saccharomyces cerevisiae]|nr:AMP_1a_G0000060.mRNA.1.CDS.1 [Saccharomyces cerevisiae]CAI6465909.1 AMP_1a_G0000060.mRNA.1.CDS.1 [Saccharomyces cerevisiae]
MDLQASLSRQMEREMQNSGCHHLRDIQSVEDNSLLVQDVMTKKPCYRRTRYHIIRRQRNSKENQKGRLQVVDEKG